MAAKSTHVSRFKFHDRDPPTTTSLFLILQVIGPGVMPVPITMPMVGVHTVGCDFFTSGGEIHQFISAPFVNPCLIFLEFLQVGW